DWLVAFLFVALAAGSFWLGGLMSKSEQATGKLIAVVMAGNRQLTMRDLSTPSDFAVRGAVGEMLLQVANRRIHVLRSTCSNQVCVRQGAVHRPGEMLVCVPNRVVVFIRRANEAKFTRASGDSTASDKTASDTMTSNYDAVTY
ncbi:MAG: NusG domain II-containing protein, partial [bacterium]